LEGKLKSYTPIGIDRRLQLAWLESTASLYLAGTPPKEICDTLRGILGDKLSVGTLGGRGTLEKTITILMRIWATTPKSLHPLKEDGLALLQTGSVDTKLAVHWGMTIAVYPFWGTVAEITGRLLKLQGSATISQILRRVKEQLGERETAIRAAQRVVRSYVDWGLLLDSSSKGLYAMAPQIPVNDERLAAFLIEAALRQSGSEVVPLKTLMNSSAIFPFKIQVPPISRLTGRVELHRQGLDEDILMLKN
jgi:hypothetical protein